MVFHIEVMTLLGLVRSRNLTCSGYNPALMPATSGIFGALN
jgi:hypothetical protein